MFIRHREGSRAIHSRWSRLGDLHPGPTHYERFGPTACIANGVSPRTISLTVLPVATQTTGFLAGYSFP
jgi:hypothetical protein